MKRRGTIFRLSLLASLALVANAAEPASDAPPVGPIIDLPPLVVNASRDTTKWRYASVGDDEYLSGCSVGTTRSFIESRARMLDQLRTIVPDEFLAHLPTVTILVDSSQQPNPGDSLARDVLATATIRIVPNLRIDGRDLSALFIYIDEKAFAKTELTINANYLRFLLERRTPMLPPWLIEGVLSVHGQIDLRAEPVTLGPFVWLSLAESGAIARNPTRPRALLPAGEMFAPDVLRGAGNHDPRRVQTLQAQVGLFVRWALDPRNNARAAFWTFAKRASEQRVTEEMFFQCFGFGFSDLRDRLNDYLPLATKEPLQLDPGPSPKFAMPEVREATPIEIARLRGAWERLEIDYVQKSQPDFAGRYITQARDTLMRPYEQGEKNPWLLAEIGLCEIDAGTPAEALRFLEPAIAAGVIRPSAGYEVARLRFAELLRGQASNRFFSAAELASVVAPLRLALGQQPQLPEVFGLLADAWLRSREPAPPADVEALVRGAKYFAMNPAVSYRIALALARCGRRAEAVDLLDRGVDYVDDDAMRVRYTQLQAAIAGAAPAAP